MFHVNVIGRIERGFDQAIRALRLSLCILRGEAGFSFPNRIKVPLFTILLYLLFSKPLYP